MLVSRRSHILSLLSPRCTLSILVAAKLQLDEVITQGGTSNSEFTSKQVRVMYITLETNQCFC